MSISRNDGSGFPSSRRWSHDQSASRILRCHRGDRSILHRVEVRSHGRPRLQKERRPRSDERRRFLDLNPRWYVAVYRYDQLIWDEFGENLIKDLEANTATSYGILTVFDRRDSNRSDRRDRVLGEIDMNRIDYPRRIDLRIDRRKLGSSSMETRRRGDRIRNIRRGSRTDSKCQFDGDDNPGTSGRSVRRYDGSGGFLHFGFRVGDDSGSTDDEYPDPPDELTESRSDRRGSSVFDDETSDPRRGKRLSFRVLVESVGSGMVGIDRSSGQYPGGFESSSRIELRTARPRGGNRFRGNFVMRSDAGRKRRRTGSIVHSRSNSRTTMGDGIMDMIFDNLLGDHRRRRTFGFSWDSEFSRSSSGIRDSGYGSFIRPRINGKIERTNRVLTRD